MPSAPARLFVHETATIRPASEKDASLIEAMAQRIWPICFAHILTPLQIAHMLEHIYSVESLELQMKEGHRFWVASENGRNVGYASAYKHEDTIWLRKLYVETVAQGKGIGKQLLEHATSAFLPATEIRLLVNRENISAQDFYRRMHFTKIGEEQVRMGDYPFIDYLYRKPLDGRI